MQRSCPPRHALPDLPAVRGHVRAGARVEDGRVGDIRGDELDPLSRGHVCPKAVALKDLHEDPDRLRGPLRRTARAGRSWAGTRPWTRPPSACTPSQNAHGRHAVAVYLGNPVVHDHGLLLFSQVFERVLHSRSRFSATSTDQLPHMLASLLMFGNQLLLPVPDVDRTDFMLVLGANPLASNGSLMTAPGIERRLRGPARARRHAGGGRPAPHRDGRAWRRTTSRSGRAATRCCCWPSCTCSSRRTWRSPAGWRTSPTAWEAARRRRPLPARAGWPTRPASHPATCAPWRATFAAAPSAVAYGRVGPLDPGVRRPVRCWLVNALNVVTGNLDRAGGAMFTRPAADLAGLAPAAGPARRLRAAALARARPAGVRRRVAGGRAGRRDRAPGAGPDPRAGHGRGQPRALDPRRTAARPRARRARLRAGPRPLPATRPRRHAHLVLPPVSQLERDHYDLVFHLLAVRDTARYSPAAVPQAGRSARHDWEILLGLATRLLRRRGRPWSARALERAAGPPGARRGWWA